jgi:hypothetical protein
MTSGPHKVRIKIGDAEFEAEGSAESVNQQYADFLAALRSAPAGKPSAKHETPLADNGKEGGGDVDAIFSKVFRVDGDSISLNFLPPRTENLDADVLMLLMYAYQATTGQQMILGTELVRAANQSGAGISRVGDSLSIYEEQSYVRRGGVKKGAKYGLTNTGQTKAKEMLMKMAV